MTVETLQAHQIIWKKKPVLRAVYHDYYQRMLKFIVPGLTLEVGGGTGNLKQYVDNVTSTDIINTPWLDATCDAQFLPFKDQSFDNIVAMDVLHHIESPVRFFKEVERVLKKGGQLILLEPAITKASWFFYHFLHPEPVILNTDPLQDVPLNPARKPFDANQAIPELLFGKYNQIFVRQFPTLMVKNKEYISLWVYLLSGGFRKWCLIPKHWVKFLLNFERRFEKVLGRHLGFRLLIAIEKKELS